MWCNFCQQDVPGVTFSANQAVIGCARCGRVFSGPTSGGVEFVPLSAATDDEHSPVDRRDSPDGLSSSDEFADFEIDDFEQTLAEAQDLLGSVTPRHEDDAVEDPPLRWDAPERPIATDESPSPIEIVTAARKPERASPSSPSDQNTQSVSWTLLSVGLAVFVCGAGLMGLALLNNRPPLWQLGMPLMLGGQIAILAVVIAQLESVWQRDRRHSEAHDKMDAQMRDLCQAIQQPESSREAHVSTTRRQRAVLKPPHIRAATGSRRHHESRFDSERSSQ